MKLKIFCRCSFFPSFLPRMNLPILCFLHLLHTAECDGLVFLPVCDLHDPNVPSSLRHGVPAAVNLSLPHTTSILLTRTKLYGYTSLSLSPSDILPLDAAYCFRRWESADKPRRTGCLIFESLLTYVLMLYNIYKGPTWCNLAVCLLVTAIILYMFRTLFASILRST